MTAIGEAMKRAGFDRKLFELRAILKTFLEAGGTREDVIRVLDELRSEGQDYSVHETQGRGAPASASALPDGDQAPFVGNNLPGRVPIRSPIAGGGGQESVVNNDQPDLVLSPGGSIPGEGHALVVRDQSPSAVSGKTVTGGKATLPSSAKTTVSMPPAREPSAAERKIMKDIEDASWSEVMKIRGRILETRKFGELKKYKKTNLFENRLIDCLQDYRKGRKISDDDTVGKKVSPPQLRQMYMAAKRYIDPSQGRSSHA